MTIVSMNSEDYDYKWFLLRVFFCLLNWHWHWVRPKWEIILIKWTLNTVIQYN